jgi:hypothetical protein
MELAGVSAKRGGSKRVPDYQLPEKRRSNKVLRRRLGSRRLRQGLSRLEVPATRHVEPPLEVPVGYAQA